MFLYINILILYTIFLGIYILFFLFFKVFSSVGVCFVLQNAYIYISCMK